MKICVNGIMREMTAEEMKEQVNEEVIQEEPKSASVEERLQNLEKILEKLGFNK